MTRADAVVIALAAALVAGLGVHFWTPQNAAVVEIRSGSALVGRYALAQDRRVAVTGSEGTSQIEIRDGAVRFAASPCRNAVCIHSGWLHRAGEVAACVPNRVSVALVGVATAFDALAY
ncbi:MAG TPA: NusG domain II-containing protein [Candidatus Binatia bacterium]|nr:NusG domain II-containing protein [Candidatus Binatia bacterium]